MQIYVDADACPVKAEVEKVAGRHGLKTYFVCNGGIRPFRDPLFQLVVVAEGADAADDWIAEKITVEDICITSDIPLASRCLEKQAQVINPKGFLYTPDNIGNALASRALSQHIREAEQTQTFNAGFTQKHRSAFLNQLENSIQGLKRRFKTGDQKQ